MRLEKRTFDPNIEVTKPHVQKMLVRKPVPGDSITHAEEFLISVWWKNETELLLFRNKGQKLQALGMHV